MIEEDGLLNNATEMGNLLKSELLKLQMKYPALINNTRGRGLMCAFDMPSAGKRNELRSKAFEEGMLILACGTRSIRFRPILAVTQDDILKGIELLEHTISRVI